MTEKQFQTKKLSAICSLDSYLWMEQWFNDRNPLKYKMKPEDHLKVKTGDRFYLSKLMESLLNKLCKDLGADPIKAPDKGRKISQNGKDIYIKVKGVKVGRADVKCFVFGKMWNFEVKAPGDRMSEHQKEEQERCIKNGEQYLIIKSIDEIVYWYLSMIVK
jgi:hypothetical protein